MPASPEKLPELNIPPSQHTVHVSIIDTTSHVNDVRTKNFMDPPMPGLEILSTPSYAFSIKRTDPSNPTKYDHLIFDLGIRKDWEQGPKVLAEGAKSGRYTLVVEKNVIDILREHGDDPKDDHTGDPSTFPPTTDLIVGPGFKKRFVPAYPTVPNSSIDENAYKDRNLREIDFATEGNGLKLGRYNAFDFYGDGSFYLIEAPGHTGNHMCALARTCAEPPEFILMGGDIAHHGGEFRPTKWLPIPDQIDPSPLAPPYAQNAPVCPGELFEAIHPKRSSTEPYTQLIGPIHEDVELAGKNLGHFQEFDAQPGVFAVIAHDASLRDVVEFYPAEANGWKGKGLGEQGRWRFLRDFDLPEGEGQEKSAL
ncbi:hypothetical protein LTR62_003700 [Meristemomyces frigidus]|uniref:Uncharacterized protein n=1 Tax=Meristemomyces frigidus TaxID=1508187 RepID=A0AAN7TFC0_9PEZI|nr:hypothetical protein LTR62_003700 [Meristemomyces frigidus]